MRFINCVFHLKLNSSAGKKAVALSLSSQAEIKQHTKTDNEMFRCSALRQHYKVRKWRSVAECKLMQWKTHTLYAGWSPFGRSPFLFGNSKHWTWVFMRNPTLNGIQTSSMPVTITPPPIANSKFSFFLYPSSLHTTDKKATTLI